MIRRLLSSHTKLALWLSLALVILGSGFVVANAATTPSPAAAPGPASAPGPSSDPGAASGTAATVPPTRDDNASKCAPGSLARPAPLVHRPANLSHSTRAPLVIDLALGTPAIAQSRWPLDTVADQHGFVVAYLGTPCPAWSDPQANVVYIGSMIDQLAASQNIDPRRVYVTGFSKSGYMAYFVGCDLSRKVTAVAIMSSAMVGQPCAVARPVSELTIIGTKDLIPIAGNAHYPSVAATAAQWRRLDGCAATAPRTFRVGPVTQTTWAPCADGSAVAYYILEGGQHVIPGSAGLAPSNPDAQFGAAAAVVAFFAAHRSGSLTSPSAQLDSVGVRHGGRQIVTTLSLGENAVVTVTLSARGGRLASRRTSAAPGRRLVVVLTVPANARPGTDTVTIRIQDAYRRTVTMSRRIHLP